jgi:probable HAF family extracellular repeat protein
LGGRSSYGSAINQAGQVTGRADTPEAAHAFLSRDDQMTDVDRLGSSISDGLGINQAGQVVGTYVAARRGAFLSCHGQMRDLNDLIDPALHLALSQATAINDHGQIVANQVTFVSHQPVLHAYLLTPVPNQASWCCSAWGCW